MSRLCVSRGVFSQRGQASAELVALLAVVAGVLATVGALVSGVPLGGRILAVVRYGMCLVSSDACATPAQRRALPPCPVERSSDDQQVSAAIAFVRLSQGNRLAIERRSDGSVTVSFIQDGGGALTAGLGAHLQIGGAGGRAELSGSAGLRFTRGRAWTFANEREAAAFLRRYGGRQSIWRRLADQETGGLLDLVLGHDDPPPPDATFVAGGGELDGDASARLGSLSAGASAALGGALGRREGRDGSTTWYLDAHGSAGGRLEGLIGAGSAGADGEALVEYERDRHGRPRSLTVRVQVAGSADLDGIDPKVALSDLARRLAGGGGASGEVPGEVRAGAAGRRGGGVGAAAGGRDAGGAGGDSDTPARKPLEVALSLDLSRPADARAAAGVLDALTHPARLPAAVGALRARIAADGLVDVRRYSATDERSGLDVGAGLLARLGLSYGRERSDALLTYARTFIPGVGLVDRAECLV